MEDIKIPLKFRLLYAPVALFLKLASHLPLCILYVLADFLAFIARDVLRYRRYIVKRNIADSFPELTEQQHKRIFRKFYNHLCDYFVETIKMPNLSHSSMRKHMEFRGTDLLIQAYKENRQVLIYTSHFGNWEWTTSISLWNNIPGIVYAHIYRPLNNKWFNRYFKRLRSIYNVSVPMRSALRRIAGWKADGLISVTGFLSDQKPDFGSRQYSVNFLSRETSFIGGTEEIARKLGMMVVYFDVEMLERGRYRNTLRLISENATCEIPGEITRRYASYLETTIRRHPECYLWSHNRWRIRL